jgi:midasin
MLSSLELLLRKAEEWEQFAASHTSLRAEMKLLSILIERWRRLELQSWEHLLRCKELTYVKQAMQHWFSLSRVLHSMPLLAEVQQAGSADKVASLKVGNHDWKGIVAQAPSWLLSSQTGQQIALLSETSAASDKKDKQLKPAAESAKKEMTAESYLSGVFDMVDGFMRSSMVGQFPTRLHLLRLFALQLKQQCLLEADVSTSAQASVANIVYSVWQYYEQYLPIIRDFQDKLRSPIQEKLRDQSKIGKWDQLGTYAVIEHSERVHRKLNKLIREYQVDVLEFPTFSVIHKDVMRDLVSSADELRGAIAVPTVASIVPHLKSLGDEIDLSVSTSDDEDQEGDGTDEPNDAINVQSVKKLTKSTVQLPNTALVTGYRNVVDGFQDNCIPQQEQLKLVIPALTGDNELQTQDATSTIRLLKTPQLMKRLDGYLTELFEPLKLKTSSMTATSETDLHFGNKAFKLTDSLCADIFSRINDLRQPGVTKPMKQRAVADLISSLRSQGISHLKSTVSPQARNMLDVMSVSAPLACELSGDLSWSSPATGSKASVLAGHSDLAEQGERYYSRNVAELAQLRTQAVAPSSRDISTREVALMLGLAENIFFTQLRMRSVLAAALNEARESMTEFQAVRALLENVHQSTLIGSPELTSPEELVHSMSLQMDNCRARSFYSSYLLPSTQVMLDNLVQLRKLVQVMTEANAPQHIEEAAVVPVHDAAVCKAVENAVANAIDALMNVVVVPQTATEASNAGRLFSQMALSVQGENSAGVSNNLVASIVHSLIPACVNKLNASRGPLISLVSADVALPVLNKLEEFREAAASQYEAVMHSSTGAESLRDIQPHISVFATCLDECLIAVQKLKKLPGLSLSSKDSHDNSAGTIYVRGCFGEAFVAHEHAEDESDSSSSLQNYWSLCMFACSTISQSVKKIRDALQSVASASRDHMATNDKQSLLVLSMLAHSVLPLARRVIDCLLALVTDCTCAYKSLGKFLYVNVRIFRTLLAKGICSDQSKDDDEDGEGDGQGQGDRQFGEDQEGTGMGEGEGRKDVSDQIQNEEQLMDLKKEDDDKDGDGDKPNKDNKKQLDKEEAETGVEMSQDFDGEMYDLPEEPDQQDDQKNDQEEEDEGEELDREMGEGDLDDIVDEKQWDSDEDGDGPDQDQKDKEKFEKDSKMQGDEIEGEMHTKEDQDEEDDGSEDGDGDEAKPDKSKQPEQNQHDNDEPEDDKINEDLEDKERDKALGVDVRMDEDQTEDPADDNDNQPPGMDEQQDANEGENADDQFPEDMQLDGGEPDVDDDAEDDAGTDGEAENEDLDREKDEMEDESNADDANNDMDSQQDDDEQRLGGHGNLPDELEDQQDDENQPPPPPEEESAKNNKHKKGENAPPTFGVADKTGADSVKPEGSQQQQQQQAQDESLDNNVDDQDTEGPKGEGTMSTGAGHKDGATEQVGQHHQDTNAQREQQQRKQRPPNPFDTKGDINEMWKRRLNMLDRDDDDEGQNESKQPAPEEQDKNDYAGQFEKTRKDEASTEQVLDAAEDNEVVQLNREQNETDAPEEERDADAAMDEDMQPPAPKQEDKKKRDRERAPKNDDSRGRERDEKRMKLDRDDNDQASKLQNPEADEDNELSDEEFPDDDDASVPSKDEDQEESSAAHADNKPEKTVIFSEQAFQFGSSSAHGDYEGDENKEGDALEAESYDNVQGGIVTSKLSDSKKLWQQHRHITEAFSTRLCEQLRLILEPSLCSRLQGDYRTGKRINMRKVISYVSSGFRKDKIWLRRTKPAKREYQVMIMIDNSSSMGPAGALALSSLCMIANALTRLEVGELSVVSFADRVSVVHPFGKPFSDDSGSEIFSHFDFSAGRTMLSESLEAVRPIFLDAQQSSSSNRSASSAAVTLQLCFIISDAKLDSDNRARLDSIVRDFAEQHVLVVLIIIDRTSNPRDSIFNTRTVEFRENKVVTKPYLENFPFPYYIAIQKIDNLSDVLSDALKQWFEMISNQMNSH